MTGRVAGKVAFITGAARGQGRSHAIRLAQEGADIIAIDLAGQIGSVPYAMSTPDDLAETVKEVEALDRRIVAAQADVRDYAAVKAALDDGVAQLGHRNIVSANAGIFSFGAMEELDETHWQDMTPELYTRLVADGVAVTRATREHPDLRQGSSVRGAIDLTLIAGQLLELRGITLVQHGTGADASYPDVVFDAMVVALSGRIFLDETVELTPEAVLRQIWEDHFILNPAAAAPG